MKNKIIQAIFYEKLDGNKVRCSLCSHYCTLGPGSKGICEVRINEGGELFSLVWGRPESICVDPIEKKPLYHYRPGSQVLSFGTKGCNFMCRNCQNYSLSQSQISNDYMNSRELIMPEFITKIALDHFAHGIAYTYSEPTVFFEYAYDIIKFARNNAASAHLFHVFVSNGFFSKELLELFANDHIIDAINIDLKFTEADKYRQITGGKLKPVIDAIKYLHDNTSIHIEITNLLIPWENDSDDDLKRLSDLISDISVNIPLHFSRFYPIFKMLDKGRTELARLSEAKRIAEASGIKYVYIGNTNINGASDTHCPNCKKVLIKRVNFDPEIVSINAVDNKAYCNNCGTEIEIIL